VEGRTSLFFQIRQVFFHRLDFELKLCQVGFESIDLLRLGLEAALEMTTSAAIAITSAPALAISATIAGFFFIFAFLFV
jgi:hypothetical protein